ncbi:MAG: hypothetical protein QMD09_00155 [Desulfatibacillaceae bacterium]|nr:hypothetical protein [Desulfatibacillaceae bacterium]
MKKQESLTNCSQKACQQLFEKVMDPAVNSNGQPAGCPECVQAAKALESDLAALHRAALRHTPPMPGPVRLPVAATPNRPLWTLGFKPVLAFAASLVLVFGLAVGMGLLKTSGPPAFSGLKGPELAGLPTGEDVVEGYSASQTGILGLDYLILAGEMNLLNNAETDQEDSFFEDFLDFIAPLAGDDPLLQGRILQKETSHV